MVNKTSIAMLAMALMLAVVFFIPMDGVVAEDSEAANESFDDGESHLRFEITSTEPNTVEVIGVLEGHPSEIVIPAEVTNNNVTYSVTTIGIYAFYDCSTVTKITIPNSVTSIKDAFFDNAGAFNKCINLTVVEIPDSVTKIGGHAFQYCNSLSSVIIPDSVTSIGSRTFYGCTSLKTAIIGNGVTEIGKGAFDGCASLSSVIIPDSVTKIGIVAFSGCTLLTSIEVDENNEKYSSDEYGVLFDKNKTTLIQYPIGNERTSYEIPDSVTAIGDYAFQFCNSLSSVIIPDSVTKIGGYAFYDCASLKTAIIGNGVTEIGDAAFYRCFSLSSVIIPDGVTTIGVSAFYRCISLSSVIIPDGVTTIRNCAFLKCTSLIAVTIGNGVTTIGEAVFGECTSLKVLKIGACKISNCSSSFDTGLKYISIAKGATGIADTLLKNYEFFDSDGNLITTDSEIGGQNYKIGDDGEMHYYDGPFPGEKYSGGLDIGLIIGMIVALLAIAAVGTYFYARSKKQ